MEPTSVAWCMDQNETSIDLTQPLCRGGTAMRRAGVDDPKQPCPRPLGFFGQYLLDQAAAGCHTGPRCTPAHAISPADVPGGQRWQGPLALVCVLNRGRSARRGRQGGMAPAAGVAAGLLVGAEAVGLGPQGVALPQARIAVQHRASLVSAVGIARNNPVLVSPRLDGIRIEPPPHRAATARRTPHGADPRRDGGQGLAAPWLHGFCDQCTGDRLDQCVVQRGNKPPCGPGPACRPGKSRPWPTSGATGAPNADGAAPAAPPRGWTPAVVETRAGPERPVATPGTAQPLARHSVQPAPRTVAGTQAGSAVRDHAREASSGNTDHHDHHHASHGRLTSSPKTRTLILKRSTKAQTLSLLRTVPGIGAILSVVLLSDIHASTCFPRVQACLSSCRLVKCTQEAAGKRYGTAGTQIGHAHLQWAVSEAAVLFLRATPAGQQSLTTWEKTPGSGQAFTLLGQQLGRTVYDRFQRQPAFAMGTCLNGSGSGADEPTASLDNHGLSLRVVLCHACVAASVNA
jgi:hypothetical protein